MIQSWEKNEVRKYFIWNQLVSYENTRMKISCFHICSWKNKQFTYRHIIFLILFRDQQFFNVNNNPTKWFKSKEKNDVTIYFIWNLYSFIWKIWNENMIKWTKSFQFHTKKITYLNLHPTKWFKIKKRMLLEIISYEIKLFHMKIYEWKSVQFHI